MRLQSAFADYFAWTPWSIQLTVTQGEYFLRCRATDVAGNRQPLHGNEVWNYEAMGVNSTQHIKLFVQEGVGSSTNTVPCSPRIAVPGGIVSPRPDADDNNQVA